MVCTRSIGPKSILEKAHSRLEEESFVSLPSRNKAFVITAKSYGKTDIKFSWSCSIFLDLFNLFH